MERASWVRRKLETWIRQRVCDTSWLPVFLVFGAIAVFIAARVAFLPLDCWDETVYLRNAVTGIHPDWAPLYSLWYRGLSLVWSDFTVVYRISHGAILFVMACLTYVTLRGQGANKIMSLIGSAGLLCWIPWVTELTQVNHFDLMLVLLFMAVMQNRPREKRLLWLGVAFLFLCYVRQESLLVAIGLLIYAAFLRLRVFWRGSRLDWGREEWMAIAGLILIAAAFAFWNPFSDSRAWLAFWDHFYWSMDKGHGSQPEVIRAAFGNSKSILGAALANPKIFSSYVVKNLGSFMTHLWANLRMVDRGTLLWVFASGIVLWIGRFFFVGDKGATQARVSTTDLGIVTLLFGVRMIVSVSLFQPMLRYYFEFAILVGIFVIARFPTPPFVTNRSQNAAALLIAIGFILESHNPAAWLLGFSKDRIMFTELVGKMRSIPASRRQSWFGNEAYPLYLGEPRIETEFIFFPEGRPRVSVQPWIDSLIKKRLDVLVFDNSEREPMDRALGRSGADALRKALVTDCYEPWDRTSFAAVYLRKKGCSKD